MSYNGWMLPDSERARVLSLFPPKYEHTKASHVTQSIDDPVIVQDADIVIVGYVDDGGIEALVCTVDGTQDRPDGKVYHLTLSVAEGRASKESNDVIETHQVKPVTPTPIRTRGFLFHGEGYVTTPFSAKR